MSEFQRYAIYYAPDDRDLATFGASWLGWDIETGRAVAQPAVDGIAEATETPRRYGFHGTLKPPFKLAKGAIEAELVKKTAALAVSTPSVRLSGLALARLGQFLALVPKEETTALGELAFACVSKLDQFRRPASPAELNRRRAAGLSPRQDDLLKKWGYPFVAEEFRFHLTLTGKLGVREQDRMFDVLSAHLPALTGPFAIRSIALVGEDQDGHFRLIDRYPLAG